METISDISTQKLAFEIYKHLLVLRVDLLYPKTTNDSTSYYTKNSLQSVMEASFEAARFFKANASAHMQALIDTDMEES